MESGPFTVQGRRDVAEFNLHCEILFPMLSHMHIIPHMHIVPHVIHMHKVNAGHVCFVSVSTAAYVPVGSKVLQQPQRP